MLVLSRQKDETVLIGGPSTIERLLDHGEEAALRLESVGDSLLASALRKVIALLDTPIEHTTVDIRGDKVRHGYEAPKALEVHRKEVYEAIRRENREAAQVKPEDLNALAGGK